MSYYYKTSSRISLHYDKIITNEMVLKSQSFYAIPYLKLEFHQNYILEWVMVEDGNLTWVTPFFPWVFFTTARLFILELSGKPNDAFWINSFVFNMQMFNLLPDLICQMIIIVIVAICGSV